MTVLAFCEYLSEKSSKYENDGTHPKIFIRDFMEEINDDDFLEFDYDRLEKDENISTFSGAIGFILSLYFHKMPFSRRIH